MQSLDADMDTLAIRHIDGYLAFAHDRRLVLADLVALWQIRVEVILAIENRLAVDLGLEAEAGPHGLADTFLVDHRKHAGHCGVDQRYLGIGITAEHRRGTGE